MVCSKAISSVNIALKKTLHSAQILFGLKCFLLPVQNLQQFLFDLLCIVCLELVNGFKFLATSGFQCTELIGTFCFLLLKLPMKQLDDTTLCPVFHPWLVFTQLVGGNFRTVD